MKKKIFLYAIIALTIVNIGALSSLLYYRSEVQRPHAMREGGFEGMQKELGLTSRQIEVFNELRNEMHSTLDSLSTELAEKRIIMIEELWSDEPDSTRVAQLVDDIGAIQTTAQMKVIDHFLHIRDILTPEQRKIFHAKVLQRFAEEDRHSPMRIR